MKTNNNPEIIERARLLATEAHKNQTRKNGDAYITHPERVFKIFEKYPRKKLGENWFEDAYIGLSLCWLHDVVEDTDFILEDIEVLFGKEISSRLDILTRREKESYYDYGIRLLESKDKIVYLVKLADIEDNLNSVGDGAFSKEIENNLRLRWEWLEQKINASLR